MKSRKTLKIILASLFTSCLVFSGLLNIFNNAFAATTYQTPGALAYSTAKGSSISVAYPTSTAAGNLLVLIIGMKPSAANSGTVTAPNGWAAINSIVGAGGYSSTLGADTGNTNTYAFYKVAAGTESGSLIVTLGKNNISWGQMHRFSGATGSTWSIASATGSDATSGNISITYGTNPGVTSGDYVLGAMTIPTDATVPNQFSAEAISQTGVTFGSVTEVSEAASSNGNDIGGVTFRSQASSGTATAAPIFSATAGGTTTNVRGGSVFIRIREVAAQASVDQSHYRFKNDDGNEGTISGWYGNWGYRKAIVIDHTKVSSDLTNFPFEVSLDSDRDLADYTQTTGNDILFTSSDGTTKLSHEIDKYDPTTGKLVAWVKTNLSSTADTIIYMYYGNPDDTTNQSNASAVWDSGYKMVQHQKESTGSGAYILDSTTNSNNATPLSPYFADDSWLVGGRAFNGTSDRMTVANSSSLGLTDNYTLSAWVYVYNWNDWSRIIDKRPLTSGYDLILGDSTNRYIRFEETDTSGKTVVADSASNVLKPNSWNYITAVKDLTNKKLYVYVNGQQSGTPPTASTNTKTNTNALRIGTQYNAMGSFFSGTMDEIRISNVARSAAWISAEYTNQNMPSSFFSISESTHSGKATWKAAEDTATTIGKNDSLRLRISVKNTSATAANYNYRLQYAVLTGSTCESVPSSSFVDVTTTNNGPIAMINSSNVSDGSATTRQLSFPASSTYVAGKIVTAPSNQTAAISLSQNNFAEIEYAFQFTSAAANNTTYCLRASNSGSALSSYSKVATIKVIATNVEETSYRIRNDDGSDGSSLITKKFTGYTMAKPVMLNGNRYIALSKGSSWGNPLGKVEIWSADNNWNIVSKLATSTENVGDMYALTFPSQFPNKILIFGSENVQNASFISAYDVTTGSWSWANTSRDGAEYIVDITYNPVEDSYYLTPGSFDYDQEFIWKSSAANLLTPDNWTRINFPSYNFGFMGGARAEYFKGNMYFLRAHEFGGDVIRLNSNGTFTTVLTYDTPGSLSYYTYPYINGDSNYLMVTYPVSTPTPHFEVDYSTDGTTFKKLTDTPLIGNMSKHSERHAYAYPADARGLFTVYSITDGDVKNNYIATYYADGTLHDKVTGFASHYTERRQLIDGDYIVQGGELALDTAPYTDIKLYLNDGATWKANENTPASVDKNANFRVRFSVKNSGGLASNYNFQLQYAEQSALTCEAEPAANFSDVLTNNTGAVSMANSTFINNNTSATNQLSAQNTLGFSLGRLVSLPSNQTSSFNLGQNKYSEFEYAVKLTDSATSGKSYCLRLSNGSSLSLNNYSAVAKITVK